MGGWALALARRLRLQLCRFRFQLCCPRLELWSCLRLPRCCLRRQRRRCHGFLGDLDFDRPQLFFPKGGPLLPAPFPVAAGLLPPTLLSPCAGPELLATLPAPPARGFLLAGGAAIALLGLTWSERAFTSLQQTEPLSIAATGLLRRLRRDGILRWAHGSYQPAGSSLGGELVLDSEAFLLAHQVQHSERCAAEPRADTAGNNGWLSKGDRTEAGPLLAAIDKQRAGPTLATKLAYLVAAVNNLDFPLLLEVCRWANRTKAAGTGLALFGPYGLDWFFLTIEDDKMVLRQHRENSRNPLFQRGKN